MAFAVTAVLCIALLVLLLTLPASPDLSRYRFTPLATDRAVQHRPTWSPDGKSIAYLAQVGDVQQLFVRHLDSPVSVQLTALPHGVNAPIHYQQAPCWSADAQRVFFYTPEEPAGIWSVSVGGGEPKPVLPGGFAPAISPDGRTLAALFQPDRPESSTSVWLSSPPGAPPQKYSPSPFETKAFVNIPKLAFAPDGKKLLLFVGRPDGDQRWLLPFPPGSGQPRRVLEGLPGSGTPAFSWMPDSRRIVVSEEARFGRPARLWMAETAGGQIRPLTAGNQNETCPSVSPDGKKIAYTVPLGDHDLVQVPLDGQPARPLLVTGRSESMPSASLSALQFAFVTDRNGLSEIWLKSQQDGWERPVVTGRDFDGSSSFFMTPAVSPDGARIAYVRGRPARIWISSVSGSTPVRLSADETLQYAPVWSPDGKWIAFLSAEQRALVKVRVGSGEPAVVLRKGTESGVLDWSPTGEWIAWRTTNGWEVVSPDGQKNRALGFNETPAVVFSRDGKRLYGLRREQGQAVLFAIEVASGKVSTIGPVGDINPDSNLNPGLRFSLCSDGKSFITSVIRRRSDIWMLEGFDYRPSLLERVGLRRSAN